jgi:hypothetical protein
VFIVFRQQEVLSSASETRLESNRPCVASMSNNTTVDLQRLRYGPLGRRSTSDVIIGACSTMSVLRISREGPTYPEKPQHENGSGSCSDQLKQLKQLKHESSSSDETYALMRLLQQTQRTRGARSRILFFRRKDLFE